MEGVKFVLELTILLFELSDEVIFFLWICGGFFDLDEFEVFFIELDFFVGFEFFFFEFLDDAFDFVVLYWHEFELFLVELDFGQELVVFLFLKLLVLVEILVLAFESVVFFDEFFVGFFELLVLVIDVLDLGDFFIGLGEFGLDLGVLLGEFLVLCWECLDFRQIGLGIFLELLD